MRKIVLTIIAAVCCLVSGFCKPAEAQGLISWTGPTFRALSGGNYGQTWSCEVNPAGIVPFNTPWDSTLDNMDASAADPTASGNASANCVGMIRVTMSYHRRTASVSIYQYTDPEAAEPDGLDPDPGPTYVICILKRCACYWCWPTVNPKIKVASGDFEWNLGTATGASVTSTTTTGIGNGGAAVPAAGILSGTKGVSPGEYVYAVREFVTCQVKQAGVSYTVLEGTNNNTYQDYVMSFDEPMTASISPDVCQGISYMQTMEVKFDISMDSLESH